jgi:DNA-binding transcriptional ArsR family regulator
MELSSAMTTLGALAQASRLELFRILVQAGPDGVAARDLAARLGIPANTLSFHLKTLSHARLVHARPQGRFIFYSANYERMNGLVEFLTENCCGGASCAPARAPRRRRA